MNRKVYSEELLDAISVSKDFVERLDQLQIAKSDGLDKNFTRGFKQVEHVLGEAIAFWRVHRVYIFQSK